MSGINTLVIGDSWTSAIEADTGKDEGWPTILGIQENFRQAVAGSTALDWYSDFDNRLTRAMTTPADVLIMSLLGNDFRAMVSKGKIEMDDIYASLDAMAKLIDMLKRPRTIIMLYTDPYRGKLIGSKIGVAILNAAIKACCIGKKVEFFETSKILGDSDFISGNIHPTRAGHEKIAAEFKKILGGAHKYRYTVIEKQNSTPKVIEKQNPLPTWLLLS